MNAKPNNKVISIDELRNGDDQQPDGPVGNAAAHFSPCGTQLYRNRRRYARHYLLREMSMGDIRKNTGALMHEVDYILREALIEVVCELRRNVA